MRRPLLLAIVLALAAAAFQAAATAQPSPARTTRPATNTAIPAARTKNPFPPGPGNPIRTFPDSAMLRAQGYSLYEQSCASCHGTMLQGQRNVAPSLRGVGAGPVDFYLSTGRMPLQDPRQEPQRQSPAFSREQMNAIIAFVSSFGGPPAPTADPSKGSLSEGQHEFTVNCAGCHQVMARGGITVGGVVPNLLQSTAQQIAEAVRFGPYLMPHFDATQIDQHQLDSIARYVLWTQHPDNAGGWSIYNIGPIPEGLVAWFLGLLALVIVARLIGERTA
jgi:ubiquinol-cytochrome c reductase cytochrome c subunit